MKREKQQQLASSINNFVGYNNKKKVTENSLYDKELKERERKILKREGYKENDFTSHLFPFSSTSTHTTQLQHPSTGTAEQKAIEPILPQ